MRYLDSIASVVVVVLAGVAFTGCHFPIPLPLFFLLLLLLSLMLGVAIFSTTFKQKLPFICSTTTLIIWWYALLKNPSSYLTIVYSIGTVALLLTSLLSTFKTKSPEALFSLLIGSLLFLVLFSLITPYFTRTEGRTLFLLIGGSVALFTTVHNTTPHPLFVRSFFLASVGSVVVLLLIFPVAIFEKRPEDIEKRIGLLIEEGKHYEKKGNLQRARECYEMAVKLAPDNEKAVSTLAKYNKRLGYTHLAKMLINRVVREYGEKDWTKKLSAETHIDMKDYSKAAEFVKRGAIPEVRSGEDALRLAKTLFFGKEYRLAMRFLNGIVHGVDETELNYWKGRCLLELKRLDDAENIFKSVLKKEPNFADAHYRLAVILRLKGNINGWKREVKETLRLSPNHLEALCDEGFLLKEPKNNIVKNWSFETEPNQESDWKITERISWMGNAVTEIDRTNSAEGTNSIRITFTGGSPNYYHTVQRVKVTPGKRYRLECFIMTDGLTGRSGIHIEVINCEKKDGKIIWKFVRNSKSVLSSPFWRRVRLEFEVPQGIEWLFIRIRRFGVWTLKDMERQVERYGEIVGTAWIDAISLVQLP